MIRKISLAVAILAVGFVVAAPAQAGGGNGGKKTATLRARNVTGTVAPPVPGTAVVAYAQPNGTAAPTTASGAQSLGAKQIAAGAVGNYPVAPGAGNFVAVWAAAAVAAAPGVPVNFGSAPYTSKAGIKGSLTISGDETGGDLAPTVAGGGGPF
jgi:hypothetical protein